MRGVSWSFMQALVAAGHQLPEPLDFIWSPRIRGSPWRLSRMVFVPMSAMRFLLQHGMRLNTELLTEAANCDRVDILQLAHAQGIPVTEKMIEAATASSRWSVLVWACRSGFTFHSAVVRQHLTNGYFDNAEYKADLFALVQGPAIANASTATSAERSKKRRKSKQ